MMTNLLLDITSATIDWSRAQFALTAIYHWLFVPLTLGLAVIMGIAETCYYRTNKPFWKHVTRFWQKLFGVNFAMGVATGIILEFEFGTNWSNYSWFVGDVFGAPLAIEGILAFCMKSSSVTSEVRSAVSVLLENPIAEDLSSLLFRSISKLPQKTKEILRQSIFAVCGSFRLSSFTNVT